MKSVVAVVGILAVLLIPVDVFCQIKSSLPKEISQETRECIECHKDANVNIYQQWGKSKHYRANVGCYECHIAEKGEKDAFEHNGRYISVIVSPLDCQRCHEKEVTEFVNSHHAKAGRIMGSLDNLLAEVVEGNLGMKTEAFPNGISAAVVNGCWQCHGSEIKVNKDGHLDPATWPNTGIGRINPDGSEGSCSACHQRHEFSVAQSRRPENCGKCHMGPDHPQIEVYNESKHGINFYANVSDMNLHSAKWIVGEDYFAAPTCATCHMSATKDMPVTHNVGLRIKYNNRPPLLKLAHETDKQWKLESAKITGDMRKQNMQKVCISCHNEKFVAAFYVQYEAQLELYNEKWAKPGKKLFEKATEVLKAIHGKQYAEFANPIDYTWFELWHHEGRRVRHGVSMQAPDYTQWHGNYELARNFYAKFVPEIKEIIAHGETHAEANVQRVAGELKALLTKVLESEHHRWSIGKEDAEAKRAREERKKEFLERYDHK